MEHGLLGEEQLAAGLAEQERTGAPLGKVLIELGLIDAAIVAQALATQHGGVLKTEYGFATGFRARPSGAPVLEPPLSPAPPDGTPISSEPDLAPPAPAASAGQPWPSTAPPPQPPFRESPPAAVSAEPPEEEHPVEEAQVEPETERRGEVETAPVEPDATTPASGAEDVAGFALRIAAVERGPETIFHEQTIAAEGDLALSAEPPESKQGVESAEVDRVSERLAGVDPGPGALPATPAAWPSGAGEGKALPGTLPPAQEEHYTARRDPETVAADCDVALSESVAVTADVDEAEVDLDAAAARIADLDAEFPSAREHDHHLRSRIAVLEAELDAARLAVETATGECRAAHAAAETAAARIEQLEHELASARASDAALRSENDLLRAAAFEQSATGRYVQEHLVRQRLTDIEQRLETVSAQIAALQKRSVSN